MAPSRATRPPPGSALTGDPKYPREQFRRRATELIRKVAMKDRYAIFLEAVDVTQVPEYPRIIPRPMDLTTLQNNVNNGVYRTPQDLLVDLHLIWSNCCTFNTDRSIYFKEAVRLKALTARYYDDLIRLLIRDGVASALGIPNVPTQPLAPTTVLAAQASAATPTATLQPPPSRKAHLRRAQANHNAALDALHLAHVDVATTARKAALPVPKALLETSACPKAQARLSEDDGAPKFTRIMCDNARLTERVAAAPSSWVRLSRRHGSTTGGDTPFLSADRKHEVGFAKGFAKFVRHSAPTARRLLATVLDAEVVYRHDASKLQAKCNSNGMRGTCVQECAEVSRKRARSQSQSQVVSPVANKRRSMSSSSPPVSPPADADADADDGISRMRALLVEKSIDTSFINALLPRNKSCSKRTDGTKSPSNAGQRQRQHEVDALLDANYERMMNTLRLRALREGVAEAEREDVEDRERESAELLTSGVALAASQMAPRLLVHPLDAAECAADLAAACLKLREDEEEDNTN